MRSNKILAIYGAGGLGREVLELADLINEKGHRWAHIVFVDDGEVPNTVDGRHVYDYESAKSEYGQLLEFVVGVGEPAIRELLFDKIEDDGFLLPTLIHPDVHIPETTTIGHGVVIQYGCFVSCGVTIEDRVYIQPQCNIGHDDMLQKGSMISGMANLGGGVRVGCNSYLGMGATIRELVTVGEYSIVGMMSAVLKDVPSGMIAMGNPARVMAKNDNRRVFKG